MDSEIIAAGFRQSESMHGLRYTAAIGDEDSSVLHTIQTTVIPYGYDVQKMERSQMFSKSIRAVSKGFSIILWTRPSHQIYYNEDYTWCKMCYQKPNDVMKL